MTPERWAQIENLFHRAAECDSAARSSLLDAACAADPELRREVEALLAADNRAQDSVGAAVDAELDSIGFPLVGETISHYRVIAGLGGGGMGLVYRAEDLTLGRQVALKFLPEESVKNPASLGRFEREARSASALEHPNICPVYEFGEHQGRPFLAMQLLEGQTLRERIGAAESGTLPFELADLLNLAIQIVEGLDAAHRHGIIHRDIKPANIFITKDGQAKILDFGLAKLAHGEASETDLSEPNPTDPRPEEKSSRLLPAATPDRFLSQTGVAIGTAGYMSPEQVRGEKLDARTDLFSFGLVLYEMATGRRAFTGQTGPSLYDAILKQLPTPARQLNKHLPVKLEKIIQSALEKDREKRYQTAAEMAADLKTLKRKMEPRPLDLRWRVAIGASIVIVAAGIFWLERRPSKPLPELKFESLTDNSSENVVGEGAISNDGKYLAYTDAKGIKIKSLENGEVREVALPEELKGVNWSVDCWFPDSETFLADKLPPGLDPVDRSSQGTSIWSFSRLGGAPHKLRDNAIGYSISPDGSLIAFGTRSDGHLEREIWLMGPTGGQARKLYDGGEDAWIDSLEWSPDGKRTLYMQQDKAGLFFVTRDLNGGPITKVLPFSVAGRFRDVIWLRDGRLFYALFNGPGDALWEVQLDGLTGKPMEEPRQLTSSFEFGVEFAGATADSKTIAFRKTKHRIKSYLADLDSSGSHLSNPRQFSSQAGAIPMVFWTEGGKAFIFSSYIHGTDRYDKQYLNQAAPLPLSVTFKGNYGSTVSPDGKWILHLYFPEEGTESYAVVPVNPEPVMRVPIDGGPAQQVFIAKPRSFLSCAQSPATMCAVAEPTEDNKQVVFTAFDPMKGRGSEFARFDIDASGLGVPFSLSPDGSRVAILRSPAEPIYIVSLRGKATQEIRVKGWSDLRYPTWSADGKGLFVSSSHGPQGAALLHVDLQGNATVLWNNLDVYLLQPSPDGHHVVFGGADEDSNIWTLENF